LEISKAHAVMWMTLNPAKVLGLADRIGSLEPGKDADVVIWSTDPFSVYARTEKVFLDGAVVYDRADPARQSKSDFMLGSFIEPHAAAAAAAVDAAAGEGTR
jgi:cytosine/adenosine deaminase-related metal-dependent hydrolase